MGVIIPSPYGSTIAVEERPPNEATREQEADLNRPNPRDIGWRFVAQGVFGIVILVHPMTRYQLALLLGELEQAYPKAFMYPKVENDTQNAPNSANHALVPPSGNPVSFFSPSSPSDLSEVSGVAWPDSCRIDIVEVNENRKRAWIFQRTDMLLDWPNVLFYTYFEPQYIVHMSEYCDSTL